LTNSNFGANVVIKMFAQKFIASLRKEKRLRGRRVDVVAEQVKQVLQETDQKLILMVRG